MRLLFKFRGEDNEYLSVRFLKFGLWSLSHPAGCRGEGGESCETAPRAGGGRGVKSSFSHFFPLSVTDLFFSHKVVKS